RSCIGGRSRSVGGNCMADLVEFFNQVGQELVSGSGKLAPIPVQGSLLQDLQAGKSRPPVTDILALPDILSAIASGPLALPRLPFSLRRPSVLEGSGSAGLRGRGRALSGESTGRQRAPAADRTLAGDQSGAVAHPGAR